MHPAAGNRVLCGWDKCTDDHLSFCLFKTFDDGLFGNELSPAEKKLLSILRQDESTHIDVIMEKLEGHVSSSEVFTALFELEMSGKVKQMAGKNYVKSF